MKKVQSLKKNREFQYVYRKGKSQGGHLMVLIYARMRTPRALCGFSVSRKIGNAVVRNRVKRRMREAYTLIAPQMPRGHALIFIARKPIVEAPFKDIHKTMERMTRKAGIWKED